MKILFTGGGSGGHFYPIIAVAEEINKIVKERKLLQPKLYFLSPEPFDEKLLFENNIIFKKNPAGKLRRYFSIKNFFDIFKTGFGVIKATFQVFFIFPDVIFSKGSYASFPTVLASRLFRIPLIIHESDSTPGKVNKWAGKFATKVAVSFPEAGKFFPSDRVAETGNPIRKELYTVATEGAHEFLRLEKDVPVILILGGSQGSVLMNDLILEALPELVKKYQILHQTGIENFERVNSLAEVILTDDKNKGRYRPFEYLNTLALRMSAGASDLIISRGGSTIFEIALWEIPSIIIPIADSNDNHQHKNAFSYARTGAAIVIEESNLTSNILIAEIDRVIENPDQIEKMKKGAKEFAHPDAARKIAEEVIRLALKHG